MYRCFLSEALVCILRCLMIISAVQVWIFQKKKEKKTFLSTGSELLMVLKKSCIKLLLATVSVLSISKSHKFSNSSVYWRDYFSQILMHVSLPNGKLCVPDCIGFILNMFQVLLPAFQDDLVDEVCVLQ